MALHVGPTVLCTCIVPDYYVGILKSLTTLALLSMIILWAMVADGTVIAVPYYIKFWRHFNLAILAIFQKITKLKCTKIKCR